MGGVVFVVVASYCQIQVLFIFSRQMASQLKNGVPVTAANRSAQCPGFLFVYVYNVQKLFTFSPAHLKTAECKVTSNGFFCYSRVILADLLFFLRFGLHCFIDVSSQSRLTLTSVWFLPCRSDPLHFTRGLSSLLGRGPAQALPAD